jgi:hypothetical protein
LPAVQFIKQFFIKLYKPILFQPFNKEISKILSLIQFLDSS